MYHNACKYIPIYQLFCSTLAGNHVVVGGGGGVVVEILLRVLCLEKKTDKFKNLNRQTAIDTQRNSEQTLKKYYVIHVCSDAIKRNI